MNDLAKRHHVSVRKLNFFEREMRDFDLLEYQKKYLREQMLDGLEIMSLNEITKCIEDHKEVMGWL